MHEATQIKEAVRERYARTATAGTACCEPAEASSGSPSCGCGSSSVAVDTTALGYSAADLAALPEGADLGLGCGNPLAMLELREGETVLDLGSGGGIDCFITSKRVGPSGHVVGVDMTPEMVARARRAAERGGYANVEFRLGEIEHLPIADGTIDAIISNCVINLAPDKAQVFAEAFRALRPGGRLSVSDIVTLGEIPVQIRDSVDAYVACLSGAVLRDDYLALIAEAGLTDIRVTGETAFDLEDVVAIDLIEEYKSYTGATEEELRAAASMFQSIRVAAVKPA
jgi:arsenite methyltransferase